VAELLKCPLILIPQPEGGFTVTSTLIPELATEGDTAEEALENVQDALRAVIELYEDMGKDLPENMKLNPRHGAAHFTPDSEGQQA
jgi:antitoxin HicB